MEPAESKRCRMSRGERGDVRLLWRTRESRKAGWHPPYGGIWRGRPRVRIILFVHTANAACSGASPRHRSRPPNATSSINTAGADHLRFGALGQRARGLQRAAGGQHIVH